MQAMLDEGVSTRRGIMCAHREEAWRGSSHGPLPQSESAQNHCVLLPLYPDMMDDDQERTALALRRALGAR
jgi:dTDP-4-amino-4,6-dideoxygalactose transaminase